MLVQQNAVFSIQSSVPHHSDRSGGVSSAVAALPKKTKASNTASLHRAASHTQPLRGQQLRAPTTGGITSKKD